MKSFEYVVVGAGIMGLSVARELALRGSRSVCLLEKEPSIGLHSSGRNSGVLHAGIYYGTDTLKARFCSEGGRKMREYAEAHGIAVNRTGKVIIATSGSDAAQVDALYRRALENRIRVNKISIGELKSMEPLAATVGEWALYSPDTAVVDIKAVLDVMAREIEGLGVEIHKHSELKGIDRVRKSVHTDTIECGYGYLVNTAGLHADRVAHMMGAGTEYAILPFKGTYKKLCAEKAGRINGLIYPVPDLTMPFLGVHFTKTVDNEVVVGPTAIPALGRENYGTFQGLVPSEVPAIFGHLLKMMVVNDNFRHLVREELRKYGVGGFVRSARRLVPSLEREDLSPTDKVGIRAQLVNTRTMKLEMDFIVEQQPDSLHLLNAVSPAFTCSLSLAGHLADRIMAQSA